MGLIIVVNTFTRYILAIVLGIVRVVGLKMYTYRYITFLFKGDKCSTSINLLDSNTFLTHYNEKGKAITVTSFNT